MKKPATVFLGEMTNPELEAALKTRRTVLIPVGATEQHGPHGPLLTDVLIPQEIARRAADRAGALVAPPVNYALSYPHVGFTGVVHLRLSTFSALIVDLAVCYAKMGFEKIIFLNGHYDNTYALAYACAEAEPRLGAGARAYPLNYWDGMTPEESALYYGPGKGLHANQAETSAVLAINPALVDMENANCEHPAFPECTVPPGAAHTAFFFTTPGSVFRATRSGTWGDATASTAEFGEGFLEAGVRSTLALIENVERMFAAFPPRDEK